MYNYCRFITSSVTYRRYLLDLLLEKHSYLMQGWVLDIGGKKERSRGVFKRPAATSKITKWLYINIDLDVSPDLVGDCHSLPIRSGTVDTILCCEVLEHVAGPDCCCLELARILKPNGVLILSVPFAYPIHADPYDWGRFTPIKLKAMLDDFEQVTVTPMGDWMGTIGMLLDLWSRKVGTGFVKRFLGRGIRLIGRSLSYRELKKSELGRQTVFSTGYFCVAHKGNKG